MGDYLETASFGTIVLAVLLLAYHRWMKKEKNSGMGNGKCLDDAGRISFYDDGTGYIEK